MVWRLIGDKPLSEPMVTQFTDAALGEDEIILIIYLKNDTHVTHM